MKSYATPFAVAGAVLTAALLAVLNLITTPDTLWCVYPIYAAAWWPIGVYLCRHRRFMLFAAAGSVLTIAFLAAVNMLTSPGSLWFLYAALPLLLLPAGVYLKDRMQSLPVAAALGIVIIAYCSIINILLTPGYFWAIYPIFGALWWPMGQYFTARKAYKAFSVAGAALTIAFLTASNMLTAAFPWALYACFPVLLWPAAMFMIKKLGGRSFSIIGALCLLLWYGALNMFHSPGSPWVIFVAFPVLWWPLSLGFYGRRRPHIYAIVMSVLSIAFFTAVNAVYSPGALWAFYPAFALVWWPMTLLFARLKAWRGYSFAAGALTIAFLAAVNVITSPGFPWSAFPALGILWWPLAMCFKGKHMPFGFSVAGTLLIAGTLLSINLITSPSFIWSVFPILGVLWWPAAVLFAKKKSPLGLSIAGSVLATALLVSINLMTSPGFPWCVFAVFAVLWWPLSVYFHVARRRRLASGKA